MHASFVAGDVKFMVSDGRPGSPPDGEDDVALSLATAMRPKGSGYSTRSPRAGRSICRSRTLFGAAGSGR